MSDGISMSSTHQFTTNYVFVYKSKKVMGDMIVLRATGRSSALCIGLQGLVPIFVLFLEGLLSYMSHRKWNIASKLIEKSKGDKVSAYPKTACSHPAS